MPGQKTPIASDHPVKSWNEFKQCWGGLHNLLLSPDFTAFKYTVPPLERIIAAVSADPDGKFRSGVKGNAFDLTDISDQIRALPLDQAMSSRFVLAHFRLHPNLTGPGQVFEGLDEQWVEPWRQQLLHHGFTFERVYPILFCSGPHSASNYHMDYTHQLAWQCYGTKHFHGVKDPDRWTTLDQRGKCELVGMEKPAGLREEDTYAIVQHPGTMLWNPVTIPHWVETFDQCAATLTLVHLGLRLNGELCLHGQERERWLSDIEAAKQPVAA